MRTVWKWILGVLLVLVVMGAFAAGTYFWWNRTAGVSYRSMPDVPFGHGWQGGPMMRGDGYSPMRPGDRFDPRDTGPMMLGFRIIRPFGGIFALGGGLLRLIVFGALLYGAYWLGRRNARVVLEPRQPRAPEPPPAPPEGTSPPPPAE